MTDLLPEGDFFRSAFDHMLEGIQILGHDWRYLYINPAAEVHNRRPASELLGNTYADMWPGITETHVYQVIEQALAGQVADTIENRFVFPDGSAGWFELRIQPVPGGVLVLSSDITARKKAETQLGQMKRLYATLSEVNQAIMRFRDPEELYREICQVAVDFGGFSLAWVGLVTREGDLLPTIVRGDVEPKWPQVPVNIHRGPGRESLGVRAILTQKTVTSENVRVNREVGRFNDSLGAQDLRSGAAIPIKKRGEIIGILALARTEEGFFQSEEEICLLDEIGLDISFALDTIDTERLKRQWADAFEYCAHGIVIGSASDLTIVTCNPAFARDQRSSVAALTGRSFLNLYRSEDREFVQKKICEAQSQGFASFEGTKLRDDGSTYDVAMDIVGVKGSNGRLLYLVTTQLDITARKRAERLLRESEAHLKAIFNHSPVGIVMSRLDDGKIIEVNEAFARFHGYLPGELLGRTSGEMGLWADGGGRAEMVRRLRAGEGVHNLEIRSRKKSGETGTLLISTELIEMAGETYSLGLAQDITERKVLEAQLVQAQKLESLGTLSSGIAHDFNNLLAVILGQASLLEKSTGDPGAVAARGASIRKAGLRGADLVRQLLTFARKNEVKVQPVDLNDLAADVAGLLEATFAKTLVLKLVPDPSIPAIEADPSLVHQVLLNLCINARDAMDSKGNLTLRTYPDTGTAGGPWVVLEVTDTGTGMDDATLQRIFEPFFTTKDRGKGTGLGLSMVFGTMASHRGTVTVKSAPGAGTSFYCRFPVPGLPEPRTPGCEGSGQEIRGGTETILVVEDEEPLRKLIQEILEGKGYRVLSAADGESAFHLFRSHLGEIGLVVSDLGLPTLAGDDLFRSLVSLDPGLPVVLSSGFFDPGVKGRLRTEGVFEFLQKPWIPGDLLLAVRRGLDHRLSQRPPVL